MLLLLRLCLSYPRREGSPRSGARGAEGGRTSVRLKVQVLVPALLHLLCEGLLLLRDALHTNTARGVWSVVTEP